MAFFITIIIFGIIVLIHEFGHYITAIKSGVYVKEFAFGMGPKIFGLKKGNTLYSIRLFPIGGFCKMAEDDDEELKLKGFKNAKLYQKMIIVLAGVFMNFLLAFIVSAILVMSSGFAEPVVRSVEDGYPAKEAGLKVGDRIVAYNNKSVNIYDDFAFNYYQYNGGEIELTIERNGERLQKFITPQKTENGKYIMGISFNAKTPLFKDSIEDFEKAGFFESCKVGFWSMCYMVKITFYGLKQLVTMQVSMNQVTGPIGLTTVVGTVYEQTKTDVWVTIMQMARLVALLSANLGVMNILPIPALDGGRFIFLFAEFLRGKPIPPEKEGTVHLIGFVILMIFGILIAFNDILRLI